MNYFSTKTLRGSKTDEDDRCDRCGAQLKLISRMMDPRRGRTARIYRCQCGEQAATWADDAV